MDSPSDQLLSRTALTADGDTDISARDSIDATKHLAHLRRAANDACIGDLVECLVLPGRRTLVRIAERIVDGFEQTFAIDRFGEVVVRPGPHGAHDGSG